MATVTSPEQPTILVVEDDPGIATLERRRLERAGYATAAAATAEEALARVAAGGIDLVVLDYSLPGGITGLELYTRLQAAGHDLPVIMVTGQSSEAVVIQALRLGIHDFVTKSVEYLDYLPEAVGRVLAQVRTERRLEESEEQFRATFEQAAVGIAHVGLDGRWLAVNQRLCDIVGYPREELLARRYQELTHPDDLAADLEQHRRLLAGEMATYALEKRYLRRDGAPVWINLTVSLARDPAGRPRYFISVVEDIGERKRAEAALRGAEARYRALVEQIPAAVYTNPIGQAPGQRYISPYISALVGYAPEEWLALGRAPLHPDDRERVLAAGARSAAAGVPFAEEYRFVRRDGAIAWVRDESVVVRDEAGRPQYWQGLILDITARKQAEAALRASEASLAEAQRIAHLGSWEHDPNTGATWWSDEIYRILGLAPRAVAPSYPAFLARIHPEDRAGVERAVQAARTGGRGYDHEYRVTRPDGTVRTVQGRTEVVGGAEGRQPTLVGTMLDITERKHLEERLQHQAFHDPLTALPNRALFTDRLGHALARGGRQDEALAVLFLDLDGFKVINDSLGHEAGDRFLVAAAHRLGECLRAEDTLARFGGDEFAVLLEQLGDGGEALRVAERIIAALQRPLAVGRDELVVSGSIGIALVRAGQAGAGDLLRQADTAMYRAKQAGKARYELFDPSMAAAAEERLALETALRRALELGQFELHYQPKVALATGRIEGLEALVRWRHPEWGLMPPARFIPLAEETGLILPLGRWVLAEACRQAVAWQGRHPAEPPLTMAVNLSARQFLQPDLVEEVATILRETGLPPARLRLELTESVAMAEPLFAGGTLQALRALGVQLAIDDFGTGYSSLAYLKRLPVDMLKIDKAFVAGLGRDAGDTAIVRSIITLARTLGLAVTAEGIEAEAEVQQLRELGCDLGQGYYFARPAPPDAVEALLARGLPRAAAMA